MSATTDNTITNMTTDDLGRITMAMPGYETRETLGTRLLAATITGTVFATVFTLGAPLRVVGALWSDDGVEARPSLMSEARSAARAATGYALGA